MFINYLGKTRALDSRIEQLYTDVETRLKVHGLWQLACEDAQSHAPKWHEFPLIVHIERTVEAAQIVLDEAKIDLRMAMILHDVAKIDQFISFQQQDPASPGYQEYRNHEQLGASIARKLGFDQEIQFLVRWHDLGYTDIKTENLLQKKCQGDKTLLTKLILVFACDAFGKGWVPNQKWQRPKIALNVSRHCQNTNLEPWVEPLALRLILSGVSHIG